MNGFLGYTVAVNRPSSRFPDEWAIVGNVHPEREPAENHQAYCEATAEQKPEKYGADVRYAVVEVRISPEPVAPVSATGDVQDHVTGV